MSLLEGSVSVDTSRSRLKLGLSPSSLTTVLALFQFVAVSVCFPYRLRRRLSAGYSGFWDIMFSVPETKGKTLEPLDEGFNDDMVQGERQLFEVSYHKELWQVKYHGSNMV